MFQKLRERRCKKVGHKWKIRRFVIRKEAHSPFVVEDFMAHKTICARCGKEKKMVIGRWLDGFNSCEMPSEHWDRLRANGYIMVREL